MKQLFTLLLFFTISSTCLGQNFNGLWEFQNSNGQWIRFNRQQNFEQGQGWLKQSEGKWSFNKQKKELTTMGLHKPYIDTVSYQVISSKGDVIRLSYEENGKETTKELVKITTLPRSIEDQLYGVWKLSKKTQGDEVAYENPTLEEPYQLIFRHTRVFERLDKTDFPWGQWQYKADQNLLVMNGLGKNATKEEWKVDVSASTLVLSRVDEKGVRLTETYQKSDNFDYEIIIEFDVEIKE